MTLKKWPVIIMLVGVALVVAAYFQSLHYPFVSDDLIYIPQNSLLAGLQGVELWRLFTRPYNDFLEFLPLRDLSYWLDMNLFGLYPAVFRTHNIILYVCSVVMVYFASSGLRRYFYRDEAAETTLAASAAVTLLFALHPSHAEAVVWIAGRKDVMAGMFGILAIWLATLVRQKEGFSAKYAIATLFALSAAMMSKASAVAVAPVIALLWLLFWKDSNQSNRRYLQLIWPLSALLLATVAAYLFATFAPTKMPLYFGVEAITRTVGVLGWLARLGVSPESRHYFYPVFEDPLLMVMVSLGIIVLVAVIFCLFRLYRRRSLVSFAVVAFFLLCLPSLQLIPYAPPSMVSDRFIFLAAWPAILLLVALAWRFKQSVRLPILLLISVIWGFQTVDRIKDWSSVDAMLEKDVLAYPGYFIPLFQKATVQLSFQRYPDAIATASLIEDESVRKVTKTMVIASYAVNVIAENSGRPNTAVEAQRNFGSALQQMPESSKWDSAMLNVWRYAKDIHSRKWKRLLARFPDDPLVRQNVNSWKSQVMRDQ
ncbi:MAG: hypothetical protein R8M11_08910 [Gallionella sp.]